MRFSLLCNSIVLAAAIADQDVSPSVADEVGLLQFEQKLSKQRFHAVAKTLQTNPALTAARPLTWIHIPKTGSGLLDALLELPYLCNEIPESDDVNYQLGPMSDYTDKYCPGSFYWFPAPEGENAAHSTGMGYPALYRDSYLGHTVGFFRQPEQRIISQYYYDDGMPGVNEVFFADWDRKPTLAEYAHFVQGMQVKMLTRLGGTIQEWITPQVTEAETHLAVSRLEEAFVFVGITEQWDLSMCLLHKMFGGACLSSDFYNTRPGPNNTANEPYDTAELEGFIDVSDRKVYAEALRVFEKRLDLYATSMESCSACFAEAAAESTE